MCTVSAEVIYIYALDKATNGKTGIHFKDIICSYFSCKIAVCFECLVPLAENLNGVNVDIIIIVPLTGGKIRSHREL